jgi:hypothetical protein
MTGAYAFRFYNGSNTNAEHLGNWESLNGSEGVYTQEIPGWLYEGTIPKERLLLLFRVLILNHQ